MGQPFSLCDQMLEHGCLEEPLLAIDSVGHRRSQLKLRVDASPIRQSMGTYMHNFKLTDEFNVEVIDLPESFEPLCWRHEVDVPTSSQPWLRGVRNKVPMRYVRAKIAGQWSIIAVAMHPEHRTMDRVVEDIEDSKDAASYAHSFNAHLVRQCMSTDEAGSPSCDVQAPRVRVCVPVGCRVLSSAIPQFAHPGAIVMLIPFPIEEVTKYVLDGQDDFAEVPQAFFHYAVWMSGGKESLYDLQGAEVADADFLIVDPCVIRSRSGGASQALADSAPSQESFDALHPKCGQLCKGFDPMRRGCRVKRMCGIGLPSCGVP